MKVYTGSLLLTLAFTSCDVTKKGNKEVAATGNANSYVVSKNGFEYFPVSAAESSSGSYSGGSYIKKLSALNQFYVLVDLIKASFEATADHSQKREMGTGLIEVRGEDNKLVNTWMLKYKAPSQEKLEAQLKLMKIVR